MPTENRTEALHRGTYEDLAAEYYDPIRHPTCANFREASGRLIAAWLPTLLPVVDGWLCEVGPGMSLVAELLTKQDAALARLTPVDSSPSMLRYATPWATAGANLLLGTAFRLPIASESVQLLVSSLGDPYNTSRFLKEVRRVLRPGGAFVFTTPSYGWATSFRPVPGVKLAEFELSDGRRVEVPSWIYSRDEQLRMFERHGLLQKQVAEAPISELKSEPVSPKLLQVGGLNSSVVTGYLLVKGHEIIHS